MKRIVKETKLLKLLLMGLVLLQSFACQDKPAENNDMEEMIDNLWIPFNTLDEHGILGERVNLWRNHRLWYMAESGYLIDGFENRPGEHAWQGEHIGKWLHAATLAYRVSNDEKLKLELDKTVKRLIATQLADGYMGTYSTDKTFMAEPEGSGWDTWTHRYNLYGLLTYEKFYPDKNIVNACKKIADLLIETYGEGKTDLTPKLRLMDAMLKHESVVYSGDGKAYQLMANLLGYLRLYRCTGKEQYLQTVLNGWQEIREKHILVTGGPWSRHMPYNGNRECFAHTEDFNPQEIVVENCCTATWMQLNIHLFELTGLAKYFNEAEVTLLNDLYEHQHTDGIDWCYFTRPNEEQPKYEPRFSCCASSGPRGLEMFSSHLAGAIDNNLSINSLAPATIELTRFYGGGVLEIESSFPFSSSAEIHFQSESSKEYTFELRIPAGIVFENLAVNGERVEAEENARGFLEITRKWEQGDVLVIDMEYKLRMHVQDGEEGQKWIAFTYGPVALAQKISEVPDEEPFAGLNISLDEPEKILNMLTKSKGDNSESTFTIKDSGITLMPYYLTATRESGPRTYFKVG
jgi:DUF1680 family protein